MDALVMQQPSSVLGALGADPLANSVGISLSPYALGAPALIDMGYSTIPIRAGEKRPYGNGWNAYCRSPADARQVAEWSRERFGIGIATGTIVDGLQVVAVDVDLEDDELHQVLAALPPSPMEKFGKKGLTRFYRCDPAWPSRKYTRPRLDGRKGDETLVDFQADGKQVVVPPTIHPETRRSYLWINGPVAAHTLPVLSEDDKDRLEDTLRHLRWDERVHSQAQRSVPTEGADVDDDESVWSEADRLALDDLGSWVPYLDLYRWRRAGDRYEAVPIWREGGSGGSPERRKLSLKIHRTGIRDFGSGEGYSPLGLVRQALGLASISAAYGWLAGKLDLGVDEEIIAPEVMAFLIERDRRRKNGVQIIETADGALIDAETGEIVGGANDNRAAPCAVPFPEHLTRPAGVLGEMVRYIMATATKPSGALALGASLVALGSLCGRRDATPTMSGTHLFVIGLAATGVGKQHPQDAGEAMVRAATEDRGDDIMGPADLMSEGALINEIKYRPHSCSYIDEFGDLVAKMNAFGSKSFEVGIKKSLLQIWGKSHAVWRTPSYAKVRGVPIHSPAFSFFGASTPNRFYDAMSGEDRENGFLNRFLVIPEMEKVKSVDPQFDYRLVPSLLSDKLRRIYELSRTELDSYDNEGKPLDDPWRASEEPYRRDIGWSDDEAKAIYDQFRVECDALGHFYARSAEMAGRIATIVAVGRNWETPAVDADDIAYGIELARWSASHMAKQAADLVSGGAAGVERSKIFRKVQQEGGRIAQSEVMKHLGLSAKVLAEHVREMGPDGTGQLVVESIAPASGGRPKAYLRLADT